MPHPLLNTAAGFNATVFSVFRSTVLSACVIAVISQVQGTSFALSNVVVTVIVFVSSETVTSTSPFAPVAFSFTALINAGVFSKTKFSWAVTVVVTT